MFNEITLINYGRPLAERAKARKHVGPYRWRPAQPGAGRGFYQGGGGLACDPRGSSFALRLEYANDVPGGGTTRHRVEGYYCDPYGDATLTPIVARLPHGRGFLAGWTMGPNMAACLDGTLYDEPDAAARAAHRLADDAAEAERESYGSEDPEDDE